MMQCQCGSEAVFRSGVVQGEAGAEKMRRFVAVVSFPALVSYFQCPRCRHTSGVKVGPVPKDWKDVNWEKLLKKEGKKSKRKKAK